MRLLVSHQLPTPYFFQPHEHSFYYLHVITKNGVTVVNKNSRKALLSWENVESHSETNTIHEFF